MQKEVLDRGFVRLVDMMGDDSRVLDAARVSTGSSSKNKEKNKLLIDYLMENLHHTPFEKILFEWHIRCPIFVARQWMRHRVGSFNEESARYRKLDFDVYVPGRWRKQSKVNTQGSSIEKFTKKEEDRFEALLRNFYASANALYETFLDEDVVREMARIVLPMGIYTEFYWTVNFRSFMNFISLRDHEHAQFEIREYAKTMSSIIDSTHQISMSWAAFKKYGYK